jgi:hypothetical protein
LSLSSPRSAPGRIAIKQGVIRIAIKPTPIIHSRMAISPDLVKPSSPITAANPRTGPGRIDNLGTSVRHSQNRFAAPHFSTRNPKINQKNRKIFSSKNMPANNHENASNHHKLTIQKPASNTRFSQNPQQKRIISPQKKNPKNVT